MANLVTITKESRLILKIGGITCGVILILWILFQGGTLMRNLFFPKPPPPPEQAFGPLPHIPFPTPEDGGNLGAQYTVNTVDGQLPRFPDRVNVYKFRENEPSLLALEEAKKTLDGIDFIENQTKLTETLYRWTQSRTGIIIEYDIVTRNFTISSNYITNPFLTTNRQLPDEGDIKRNISGYLNSVGAYVENFDMEKTVVEYLENKGGVLTPADNLGNARFARVTLARKSVDEIPVINGGPTNSLLSFIVSYPDGRFQILEGAFYNYIVDETQKSDYPIKTATQAFEELKNGNAYIVNPTTLSNIDITSVELRYYVSRETDEYLLPVIVFNGINFTAYVEALAESSLTN